MVLGGSIQRAVATHEHGVTYRSETLRLARAYPLINFGMDFVLGRPADDTLSAWDEMFVPMRLEELLRTMRVKHSDGTVTRLVRSERQLVVNERYRDAEIPPGYFTPALELGFAITAVLLALCVLPGTSMAARWSIGIIATAWNLLAGVVGLLLLCAELFTRHAAYMGHNVNVLLATPASLALALIIPFAMRESASPGILRAARSLSILVAACSITTVLLRLDAVAFGAGGLAAAHLAVPVQAALALAVWRATIVRRRTHLTLLRRRLTSAGRTPISPPSVRTGRSKRERCSPPRPIRARASRHRSRHLAQPPRKSGAWRTAMTVVTNLLLEGGRGARVVLCATSGASGSAGAEAAGTRRALRSLRRPSSAARRFRSRGSGGRTTDAGRRAAVAHARRGDARGRSGGGARSGDCRGVAAALVRKRHA